MRATQTGREPPRQPFWSFWTAISLPRPRLNGTEKGKSAFWNAQTIQQPLLSGRSANEHG